MPEHEPATPSQPVRDIGSPAGPRGRAGFALLIVGAVFFIYWPALRGAWLWDDTAELAQNPEITGAGGLARIWWAPSQADYLPLKSTVLWLAWRVFGEMSSGITCSA